MIYTLTLNPALDRELAVAEIVVDQVLRARESRVDCGGKGFNVSRMLARLGVPNIALGLAGGRTGHMLRDGLEAAGVANDFVWIEGETRTNVSITTTERDHTLKVNEPGPTISANEQAQLLERVAALARPNDWWVLAGSLPPGLPTTFYADLIAMLKAAGAYTVLDTSGAALRSGCSALPTLLKPNDSELAELTSMPITTPAEACAAARQLEGISTVAVSMGAYGAVLVHEGQGWFASPPPIQLQNPIGAGDSFVAGMVWGLGEGEPHEALRWAVACGSATAAVAGTGLGSRDEVARLAEQVLVRSLA